MIAKISLAISILLAIAVAYLLFRKPGAATASHTPQVEVAPALQSEGGPKPVVLAFVNGDTLTAQYKFIVEKSKELQNKMTSADRNLNAEYNKRKAEADNLMAALQKPTTMDDEKAVLQQRMMQLETEIQQIQERAQGRLMKDEADLQKELQDRVAAFVNTFSKQRGIDYVVNYQEAAAFILYGSPAYDITAEIVAGLNAEYEEEKKNAEEKKNGKK